MVHRDIKPSNVLITPDKRPLLVDFGVARDTRLHERTLTESFTGSPQYAAPEHLSTPGLAPDGRMDVYGLGVTLYQCLTGKVPFGEGTLEQVFHRILTEEPAPPRRLGADADDANVVAMKSLL